MTYRPFTRPKNRGFSAHSKPRFSRKSQGKKFSGINPELYTQAARAVAETPTYTHQFSDYSLSTEILGLLNKRGFTQPTLVQHQAIPIVLEGKDLVAISQTGSGKTGSFLIPLIHQTIESNKAKKHQTTLIITPTRELAFQIDKELAAFNIKEIGIYSTVCIGGTSLHDQMRWLRRKNHFIIGTPGRLVDLVKRGALNPHNIQTVVLDEMDRMLEMGFVEDITWLMDQVPPERQALYFSATINKQVGPILTKLSPEAVYTEAEKPQASPNVEQSVVQVNRNTTKTDAVLELLQNPEVVKALVFVNTKSMAETLAENLSEQGIRTDTLHGDKSQHARLRTLRNFKAMKEGVLVATDVAARGLDVHDITHVINFDEPKTYEEYIHRIGRTGRAGKYGKAITLLVNR